MRCVNWFLRVLKWCVEKKNIVCAEGEVFELFFSARGPVNLAFKGCDWWMDFPPRFSGSGSMWCAIELLCCV